MQSSDSRLLQQALTNGGASCTVSCDAPPNLSINCNAAAGARGRCDGDGEVTFV